MGLLIEKHFREASLTLHLIGILDISTAQILISHLEELEGMEEVILELSSLEFLDSTGIGAILNAMYHAKEQNCKIKIQGGNEQVHHIFETVGLYQLISAFQEEVI